MKVEVDIGGTRGREPPVAMVTGNTPVTPTCSRLPVTVNGVTAVIIVRMVEVKQVHSDPTIVGTLLQQWPHQQEVLTWSVEVVPLFAAAPDEVEGPVVAFTLFDELLPIDGGTDDRPVTTDKVRGDEAGNIAGSSGARTEVVGVEVGTTGDEGLGSTGVSSS